jgi:branched-chain amino acid aminotransferase
MNYEVIINKVQESKLTSTDLVNAPFGRVFTDHMLVADYSNGKWQQPQIIPYGNISISPAVTALHYGQAIFEGLKAYRTHNNNVILFRPDANFRRFNKSAIRMSMPELPEEIFLDGIRTLIGVDSEWVPSHEGASLYIRPFMFATDEYVGIKSSDNYKFIAFASPVNSYYSAPVKVKIETQYVRAAEGGTGEAKTAGNYAASLYPAKKAQDNGYNQLLWTDAKEHKYIEESGTMNVFFQIENKIITPSLDGTILNGITRDSILRILKNEFDLIVEERKVTVDEIFNAIENGKLVEAFGAGTAATIAKISHIGFPNNDIKELNHIDNGITSNKLMNRLNDIRKGIAEDVYGWTVSPIFK